MAEDRGVAARVIQAQRGAQLTQGELAGFIGITEDKLSKSLHGKRRFSSLELALISEVTQVPVGDLLGMQVKVYTEKLEAEDIDRLRAKMQSDALTEFIETYRHSGVLWLPDLVRLLESSANRLRTQADEPRDSQ